MNIERIHDLLQPNKVWRKITLQPSAHDWHTIWECIPLGISITLLTTLHQSYNIYFCTQTQAKNIAHKQSKNLFSIHDTILLDMWRLLPGKKDKHRAYVFAMMFLDDIIEQPIYQDIFGNNQSLQSQHQTAIMRLATDSKHDTILANNQQSYWYTIYAQTIDIALPTLCYYKTPYHTGA